MNFEHYDCVKNGFPNRKSNYFHDKALKKANSKKIKKLKFKSKANNTLFIGNLHYETTTKQLYDYFSKYGKLFECIIPKNIITGESKRYGFVEFKHFSDAYYTYNNFKGELLNNLKPIVDFERNRLQENWKPRRIGGGVGGTIKSGQMRFEGRIRRK